MAFLFNNLVTKPVLWYNFFYKIKRLWALDILFQSVFIIEEAGASMMDNNLRKGR